MDSRDSNGVLDEATYTKQRSYVETCGGALNTVRRASFVVFGELALSVEALCMHMYSEQTARDKIQFLLRSRRGRIFRDIMISLDPKLSFKFQKVIIDAKRCRCSDL